MGADTNQNRGKTDARSYLEELKAAAKALARTRHASPALKAALLALAEAEKGGPGAAALVEKAQSSLALALAELSNAQAESLEAALGGEKRREAELTRMLLMLLRLLRARQSWVTGTDSALDDLHAGLTRILDEWGEISLRVAVDGLYMGDRPVLKVSPEDDPALFRVFQHGIRQLVFLPGLDVHELQEFIDVLTTELTVTQSLEEDVSTLLADQEFASIQFVVVETFTESYDGQGNDRTADVADVVAAALREQLSGELDQAQGSGGAVRFWSADVSFIKEANLKELVDALPASDSGEALGQGENDDLAIFNLHLNQALERWTPWLPGAALSLLEGATEAEAEAIYPLMRVQLLADARVNGLASLLPQLDEIADWVRERAGSPRTRRLIEEVFNPGLRALALRALRMNDPDAQTAARIVLAHLPRDDRFKTLNEVLLLPSGQTRRHAVTALLEGEGTPLPQLTELIPTIDYELAWTILNTFRDAPFNEELLALHYAATKNDEPKLRALALRWLTIHGGDHATNALRNALYDEDELVRGAALYLLTAGKHPNAPKFVSDWFRSSDFKKLEMKEKRLGAQMLALLVGQDLVPEMRKLLSRKNVTLARAVDEQRAAAVVALVTLEDKESMETIAKLSTSRFSGQALKTEANRVLSAHEAGKPAYTSPFRELNALAVHLRLVDRASQMNTTPPEPEERPAAAAKQKTTSAPAAPGRTEAQIRLARELLASFSYDDLPLTGADAY